MITLTTTTGKLFATVETLQDADVVARAVIKRGYSDLCYHIHETDTAGSIDLEPYSFHAPHIKRIVSNHLQTFWGNIVKMEDPTSRYYQYRHIYGDQVTEVIKEGKKVLNYIKP